MFNWPKTNKCIQMYSDWSCVYTEQAESLCMGAKVWKTLINYQAHFCNPIVGFFFFYSFNLIEILYFNSGRNINLWLMMKDYSQGKTQQYHIKAHLPFLDSMWQTKEKKLQVQVNNGLSKWTREMKILVNLCFHLNYYYKKRKMSFL